MRRRNSMLITDFRSEECNDRINKTYFAYTPLDYFVCFAIAESFDYDEDIHSAKLAVEAVLSAFERKPSLRRRRIKEYIRYAHEQLRSYSVKNRLKAGITVIVSDYTCMRYAVCGNIKLFLMQDAMFILKSKTQTYYQQVLEYEDTETEGLGEIRNLTHYLGKRSVPKPDVSEKIDLLEGATLLLSTCNLWERVSDIEILDAYEEAKNNTEFLDNVEELLLSSQEHHNIGSYTAAAVLVDKTFKEDIQKKKQRKKFTIIGIAVAVLMFILVFGVISFMRYNDRMDMAEIERLDKEGIRYSNYGNYQRALEQYQKASGLAEQLNLKNWQYKNEKIVLLTRIKDRLAVFTAIEDGDMFLEAGNYKAAQKSYVLINKEADIDTELSLSVMAGDRLKKINYALEALNLVSIGDMYGVSEQYTSALISYNQAMGLTRLTGNIEEQKNIQIKILEINQKVKEKEEARTAAAQDEETAALQKITEEKLSKVQEFTIKAIQAEGEGKMEQAVEYYEEILKIYDGMDNVSEQVKAAHEKITSLRQALSQEEKEREAAENQVKIQQYTEKALEAQRNEKYREAIDYYEEILKLYEEMNVTGDTVEKIYDRILLLEDKLKAQE